MLNNNRKSKASTGPPNSAFVEKMTDPRGGVEINDLLTDASAWSSTTPECQRDLMNFSSNRVAKDQEFVGSILTAHSLNDLLQIQSLWITEACQDYSATACTFTSISTANIPVFGPAVRFPE
jgi:aconitase B